MAEQLFPVKFYKIASAPEAELAPNSFYVQKIDENTCKLYITDASGNALIADIGGESVGGTSAWGSITGSLMSQTDLATEFGKVSYFDAGSARTNKAVPFIDAEGQLTENPTRFLFDTDTLKLGEAAYAGTSAGASAGWSTSKAFLKVGFDTPYANNTQPVYGAQFDMRRTQTSGAGQQTSGIRPRAWIVQTGGSGGIATAMEAFVDNTGSTVDTMLQAVEGICQAPAATTWISGGWFQTTASANVSFANWGVRSFVAQSGGTAARASALEAILNTSGAGAITNAVGVYIGGWAGAGYTNVDAIFIAADTNKGTNAYAIRSLSTAKSLFSGSVDVPYEAYGGSGWATNNEAVTKRVLYEVASSLGGGGAASPVALYSGGASEVPLSIEAAASQSAHMVDITTNGGTAGDIFSIAPNGFVTFAGRLLCTGGGGNYVGFGDVQFGDVLGTNFSVVNYPTATGARFRNNAGVLTFGVDDVTGADEIRLRVWDVTAGALVLVKRGAADSGGSGRRVLTVPN